MLTSHLHVISHEVSSSEISRIKCCRYYLEKAEGIRAYAAEEHKRHLGLSGRQ